MNEERLRWITRKPTLDQVRAVVDLADTPQGTIATVFIQGLCTRKRGSLWTYSETIQVDGGRYNLSDLVTHVMLVAGQDRPVSEQELTRGLVGSAWEQPELPF